MEAVLEDFFCVSIGIYKHGWMNYKSIVRCWQHIIIAYIWILNLCDAFIWFEIFINNGQNHIILIFIEELIWVIEYKDIFTFFLYIYYQKVLKPQVTSESVTVNNTK